MVDRPDLASQLAVLRASYLAQLPNKLADLQAGLRGLLHGDWEPEAARTAHRQAHNLTGSGATFGFEQISNSARVLEQLLKQAVAGDTMPDEAWRYGVTNALDVLARTICEAGATQTAMSAVSPPPVDMRPAYEGNASLIYLVEDDELLAAGWVAQLEYYGYRVRHFARLATLDEGLAQERPAAILMDVLLPDGLGTDYLGQPRAAALPMPPVIAFSSRGDFETRLAAVRAGAAAFLAKPFDISVLVERLSAILHPENADPYRIVMVEDSDDIAAYHAALLHAAGMQVEVVSDPLALMERIGAAVPDLLLLDVHMPGCSGLELATVLRQQDAFASIPIVFLSSEADVARQLQALELGGDDFLLKPVTSERLVAAVRARVKRARAMRALMTHDSLTGLLNHSASKEAIERELSLARRHRHPLAVALIDVDHFKKVNDSYGHPAGDRVLKSLAQLLKQRLRRSDLVGRYGGEEFIVALPNTPLEQAVRVLDDVRQAFCAIDHLAGDTGFTVSFSAGLAGYPGGDESAAALIDRADKALYAAKHAGRNRVQRG